MPARLLLIILLLALTSCGGHASRTRDARSALDFGSPRAALEALNEELDVETAKDVPEKVSGDNALLLLDRAMVLQSLASRRRAAVAEEYALSSRDLEIADKQIEILDLSRNATHEIGRYLFSDETGPYKSPPYEKLMINTMNMVNYLVRKDLNGGRIEARRLAVMQRYLDEHEGPSVSLIAPGSYFAGFIFEKSGRPQEALRYYDEALEHGHLRSLEAPVRRLAREASYRSPRIRKILGEDDPRGMPQSELDAPPAASESEAGASEEDETARPDDEAAPGDEAAEEGPRDPRPSAGATVDDSAEVFVIISFGRVPAKRAKRIPIGLALTYASGIISPRDHARANRLALQGLVTWVNYPELGKPRGQYARPAFALDGEWQRLEGVVAVDRIAKRAWEDAKGPVVASAITRMLSRVVAGEVARRSTGGGVVGALLSLGTQATLTAVDTPDTRSWSTLPARIAVGRVRVAPGTHWVDLEARGVRKRQRVDLEPGGWAVLNLTVLS